MDQTNNNYLGVGIFLTIGVIALIVILMITLPLYNVWRKEQNGKAELSRAEYSKQVQLEEAKANLASERLNAQAEVVRAEGAAKSIAIENGKLTDRYIQYLWVRKADFKKGTVIYVPTEGNLPILEAGKR